MKHGRQNGAGRSTELRCAPVPSGRRLAFDPFQLFTVVLLVGVALAQIGLVLSLEF